jgi:hypothetical protein
MAIPPYIYAEDLVVAENSGFATFHIRLNAPSDKAVTVDYLTADLGAVSGGANPDFTALTGSLTFAPGETEKTVQITIPPDLINEPEFVESFQLVLTNPINAALDPIRNYGTAAIVDDDNNDGNPPQIFVNDISVDRSAGTATFAVYLNQPASGTVNVDFTTADGTDSPPGSDTGADAGIDYATTTGTLAFAAGEVVKYVTVPILPQSEVLPDQSFSLNLSNAQGATIADPTGIGTITNDAANFTRGFFSVDSPIANLSTGYVDFTVRLDTAPDTDQTFTYEFKDGTAINGTNYVGQSGTFSIQAGETTAIIRVPVINQPIQPGGEFFSLVVSGTIGNITGGVSGTAFIINDQQVPEAVGDNLTITQDQVISFNVLDNDINPNHDILSVVEVSSSAGHSGVPPQGHLSATHVTNNGGTVVIDSDGFATYTPRSGFIGIDSFTYQFIDGDLDLLGTPTALTSSATVNIIVNNGTPVAVSDAASTNQNTAVNINILGNDNDPNGDLLDANGIPLLDDNGQPLTPVITTAPTHGTAEVNPTTGVVTYTPFLNFYGTDSFDYKITDLLGHSATATAYLNVINQDGLAAINNIGVAADEDKTVSINVLDNDSFPDNEVLTVSVPDKGAASGPAHGTTTVGQDGTVFYTPDPGYFGTDNFTYTLTNPQGTSSSALVTINVASGAPVTGTYSAETNPTNGLTPVIIDVLDPTKTTDPNGDPLAVTRVTNGAHGTVVINGDGTVTYTPTPSTPGTSNFTGLDSFTYTVSDGQHETTGTVAVTVNNAAPTAADHRGDNQLGVPALFGKAVSIALLEGSADPERDPLAVTAFTAPNHGTVEVVNGIATYTPDPGYLSPAGQPDSFTYTVTDGNNHFATATVTVNVTNNGNQAPVLDDPDTPFPASTQSDNPVTLSVLAPSNISDPEGDRLTVTAVSVPAHGTVSIVDASAGVITYTPTPGYFDPATPDSFTYTVSDGQGNSTTGAVNVTVADGRPTAVNDTPAPFGQNSAALIQVLTGDSDPQGDPLSVVDKSDGLHGTVVINRDAQTVTYTPELDYFGTDSFTYTISDGHGHFSTAKVDVVVTNVPPVAVDDAATTGVDQTAAIPVLANDSDNENDPLAISSVAQPQHGRVEIGNQGLINYTPSSQFVGTDSFTYTITDGNNHFDTATVTVTVAPTGPGIPVANPDTANTNQNATVDIQALANDTDPENDPLTLVGVSTPANGTAVLADGGVIRYTPAAGFSGTDTFTYTVTDKQGLDHAATGTVTVTVNPSGPGAPIVNNDSATTDQDESTVIGVLFNDSDPENDPLTVTAVSAPTNGTAVAGNGGLVTYQPKAGFVGTDSFTYTVSDGQGHSSVGTVSVTVGSGAPVVADDQATTGQNLPVAIDVLANDSDPQFDDLTVAQVSNPAHGTLVVDADGIVTYTPAAGFTGADSFSYTASDGQGHSAVGSVSLQVNGPPTVAVPIPDLNATANQFFQSGPVTAFTDAAGDPLAFSARQENGAALPTWLIFDPATRAFSGTPAPGDAGTVSITVTATDTLFPTLSASDTFILTIAPPVAPANPSAVEAPAAADQPPATADQAASVQEGAAYTFSATDFPFSDPDAGDTLQAVKLDSLPAAGRLALNGQALQAGDTIPRAEIDAGHLSYQAPAMAGSGSTQFTFKVGDGQHLSANDGQFTLNLVPIGANGQSALDGVNSGGPFIGKKGADALFGDSGGNLLNGKGGDDRLYGGDGADILKGGSGHDALAGGSGGDKLLGQGGRDVLIGGAGDDFLNGGSGKDTYLYQATRLGADDLQAGTHDKIVATKGDIIAFDPDVMKALTQHSASLSDLDGMSLDASLGDGSNIAFNGHSILIDADGNGADIMIDLVGVHRVSVAAGGEALLLG